MIQQTQLLIRGSVPKTTHFLQLLFLEHRNGEALLFQVEVHIFSTAVQNQKYAAFSNKKQQTLNNK